MGASVIVNDKTQWFCNKLERLDDTKYKISRLNKMY